MFILKGLHCFQCELFDSVSVVLRLLIFVDIRILVFNAGLASLNFTI